MSDDEKFTPRLGKMRGRGDGKGAYRYVARVVAAATKAPSPSGDRIKRFDGSRIGRGASMGRALSSRDRLAAFRARRVVVKTRLVRIGARGISAARAHLRYIERDGVTREGSPGELYSADRDTADGKAFLARSDGDRHQFRFIVSAEDGAEYPDLKPFVRRLMTQMEEDLGTRLDWVAVDHFNTGRPHTHIMLRGVDDRGQSLVVAREYLSHGIRERAVEIVSLDLGPRTTVEIESRLRQDVAAERLTAIDRRLLRDADADHVVAARDRDPLQQSLRAGRLRTLGRMGLAEPVGGDRWRLGDGLEGTLRAIGERGDVIRTMQRELTARRIDRIDLSFGQAAWEEMPDRVVVGRVIMRGISDDLRDRHYLLVDCVDGRAHHIDLGRGDAISPVPEGSIVAVTRRNPQVRDVDRTVAAVAAANDGRYSVDLHLIHDPSASEAFAGTHVRRLEAMRRSGIDIDRATDGSWVIPHDHLANAQTFEERRVRDRPVEVETLSAVPLARLPRANAATWLDRELANGQELAVRDAGFGQEVRAALAQRRQWLLDRDLAEAEGARIRLRRDALAILQRRELLAVSEKLAGELGKPFAETAAGDRVDGMLTRRLDLVSGRFALVENAREFTLVPWRSVLEPHLGKQVSGLMRGGAINWQFGRGRAGPEIG